MKYITAFTLIVFTSLIFQACETQKKIVAPVTYTDIKISDSDSELKVEFKTGNSFNHPTYVLWVEDMQGNYIQTLFITQSYASGIFGHQMLGDSVWLRTPGESYQPAALPYWTYKKGDLNGKGLIPTPDNPYTDAYTGATPLGDLTFSTSVDIAPPYRVLLEVNQPWDWDKYWTNNKYPGNDAYEHSAQPSVLYAVSIDSNSADLYMNPIGYGDPKGESGKLFTNLNNLSSAKQIFKSIELKVKK